MNEERFERTLRSVLTEQAPESAPPTLRARLDDLETGPAVGVVGRIVPRLGGALPALGLATTALVVVAVAAWTISLVGSSGWSGIGSGGGGGSRVLWATAFASFKADDFWIEAGGRRFLAPAEVALTSDPGTATYRTLEAAWREQGVEMRLNIYFESDGAEWWVSELRTYDGKAPGDWITYSGPLFRSAVGGIVHGSTDLTSDSTNATPGRIHFGSFALSSFGVATGNANELRPVVPPTPNSSAATLPPTPADPEAEIEDTAAVIAAIEAYESALSERQWATAWTLLSPWAQRRTTFAEARDGWESERDALGSRYLIEPPSRDWTILNYAYVGEIEASIRATADAERGYAVWVRHPDSGMESAGSEGFIVAPLLSDGSWRIWPVH